MTANKIDINYGMTAMSAEQLATICGGAEWEGTWKEFLGSIFGGAVGGGPKGALAAGASYLAICAFDYLYDFNTENPPKLEWFFLP